MTWDQDPFSKNFKKKNNGQISFTGPDLDPEKIVKFDDLFGRQTFNFLQKALKSLGLNLFSKFKTPVCSIFHSTQY